MQSFTPTPHHSIRDLLFTVAMSPAYDRTIQFFLVQGPVDNFTQSWTGESLVFDLVFTLTSLSSSMTQDLATLYKILFTRGRFRVQNASKSFSFFGQGGRPRTPLGELRCYPRPATGKKDISLPFPFPSVYSVFRCAVQFFQI